MNFKTGQPSRQSARRRAQVNLLAREDVIAGAGYLPQFDHGYQDTPLRLGPVWS
jgi:hypothetical protein